MIGAIEALAGIVTVAIPARNRASLLQATLRTVAAQTVAPAEIIVADDGSTDATQAVAEASGARVLSKRGGGWGSAGARNAALAEASGEFIFFLDSDDLLLPIALERLGGALLSAPGAPFAYGRALAASRESDGWRPEGLIAPISDPSADPFAVLFARNAVPACGALVRTEEARAVGGYDETMPFSEDQDFFVRLALRGDPVSVPEVVAVHRRHPGNKQTGGDTTECDLRITALADEAPQLRRYVPARAGRQLAELALKAAHERRPGPLVQDAPAVLRGSGAPLSALRHAASYLRERWRLGQAGDELWRTDPMLREWLNAQ